MARSPRLLFKAEQERARYRSRQRVERRLERYGLTTEGYERLLAQQNGGCAVCGSTDPGGGRGQFSIDHDHRCCAGPYSCGGCVRGLLCNGCNRLLGYLHDNPALAAALIRYLES